MKGPGRPAAGPSFARGLRIAAIVTASCLSPASAGEERANAYFLQGNRAYESGDFEEAARAYRKAVDEGLVDSRLYYNYANSLFRLERLGHAILHYERALKLAPDDEDIRHNLEFAGALIVDKIPAPEANALTRVLWKLHSSYSVNHGLWSALLLFTLVFAAAALKMVRPELKAAMGPFAMLALLVLLFLGPSLAYRIYRLETVSHAVVLDPALEIFSGPGDTYELLSKIHEGTKVELVQAKDDWALVKLPNGKGGFVRARGLGHI